MATERIAKAEHEEPGHVAPVAMEVGAADDHAEHDAEHRAQQALTRLAASPPSTDGLAHPDDCRIHRAPSPAPSGGATIGLAGGPLGADLQEDIEGSRSGGRALPADVRAPMESAFGRSFAGVKVHHDATSARIARSISADAFTTGNDIFFGAGAFAPETPQGRHVLAHELGHVVQGSSSVHRWNPFKSKPKSPEEVAKIAEAKQRKEKLIAARAELKAKDKAVRTQAKQVNAKNKEVSKQVKGAYAGQTDPTFKPPALIDLEMRLKDQLDKERYVRSKARHEVLQGQQETPLLKAQADLAEEQAVDEMWAQAPQDVRAFRPLRYDDFDKALKEVRDARNDAMAEERTDQSKLLEDNEAKFGAPMSVKDAGKKVAEQRQLDRRRARMNGATDPATQQSTDDAEFQEKAAAKVAEVSKERGAPLSAGETKRLEEEAKKKAFAAKYGQDQDVNDAQDGVKTTGKVLGTLGKIDKKANKGLKSAGVLQKGSEEYTANDLAAKSCGGLGEIFNLISILLGFSEQVKDIRKGAADPGAKLEATKTAVGAVSSGAKITRTTLLAAREGVKVFGGNVEVISQVGQALPIVGLITSALGTIDCAIDLIPVSERLAIGVQSVQEAELERKGPLAASMTRVNSRNAQLVEKATFGLVKNVTMLSLHVAELASAGGFGIPAAAKATITITDLCHKLGHKIYDVVNESKSSTAIKDYGVKHQEGASRDVLKYDIGTSIDVIIVAAQKHKMGYAREMLLDYGIYEREIDTMRHHELREKILDKLDAEGDPKTVTEKIEAAKKSVKEKLGLDDKPGPKQPEKSTLEKIKGAPGALVEKVAGIPEKIQKKVTELKDAHADAKMVVDEKNKMGYKGNKERGKGSVFLQFMRGGDKTEKSLAKVRSELAAGGTAPDQLPRTKGDKESREKKAEAQKQSQEKKPTHQFDPKFAAKVSKATLIELYQLAFAMDKNDPCYEGNLEYLEYEVKRRVDEGIS